MRLPAADPARCAYTIVRSPAPVKSRQEDRFYSKLWRLYTVVLPRLYGCRGSGYRGPSRDSVLQMRLLGRTLTLNFWYGNKISKKPAIITSNSSVLFTTSISNCYQRSCGINLQRSAITVQTRDLPHAICSPFLPWISNRLELICARLTDGKHVTQCPKIISLLIWACYSPFPVEVPRKNLSAMGPGSFQTWDRSGDAPPTLNPWNIPFGNGL